MPVSDDNRSAAASTRSAQHPEPPPVGPDDRPTIEPSDAVPSDDAHRPGLLHEVTSSPDEADADRSGASAPPAARAGQPSPPPVDPQDRPTIEPADARPTDE